MPLNTIPPEDGKNDDDIADDKRKPAAKRQEEMLTTAVQEKIIQNTIPSVLAIGGKVLPWVLTRDGKEVKGAYLIKRTIRNKLCLTTRQRKGVGKVNH